MHVTGDDDGQPAECGHVGPGTPPPLCVHLREHGQDSLSSFRCYTGVGLDYLLLCRECADRFEGERPPTALLCSSCLERITSDLGEAIGVRDLPEVLVQHDGSEITPTTRPLADSMASPLIDIAPGAAQQWFGLCTDGTIVSLGPGWSGATVLAAVPIPADADPGQPPPRPLRRRLHVAPSGRFAAVVNDYGRSGVVVDLMSGRVTMALDGGDGHPWTVPFSLAFATHRDREVIVHRTAWNRLDVSDAESGRLLTAREPTSYGRGEARPAHYLDYFHGGLHLSPDGRRVLDDGWVWHPIGIPAVWDLQVWLDHNVWESEDGATRRCLAGRMYYWDHGMCWIDAHHVAVEGIGSDDDHMVAGVRIFDVTKPTESASIWWPEMKETAVFAGPSGEFFSDGQRLFTSAENGLSVWKLATGERTAQASEFRPRRFCAASGELAEIRDGDIVVWSSR